MENKAVRQPTAGGRLSTSRSPLANYLHNRALSLRRETAPWGAGLRSPVDCEGMIVDQTLLKEYRMGAADSARCGCGWIACYNALAMLGCPESPARVIREMEHAFVLRGHLGTQAAALIPFFLRRGFRVSLRGTVRGIDRRAADAEANILYYIRAPRAGRLTAHFVAFSGGCGTDEKGQTLYRFYNSLSAPVRRRGAVRGETGVQFCAGGARGDLRTLSALLVPEHPVFVCALSVRNR